MSNVKKIGVVLYLMGLLLNGGVYLYVDYLKGFLEFVKKEGV